MTKQRSKRAILAAADFQWGFFTGVIFTLVLMGAWWLAGLHA